MSRLARALIMMIGILVAGSVAAKDQKPAHVYGPEPSWAEFRRLAEASITASLIDPGSAQITWLSGIHKGGFKPFLSRTVEGYVACGSVNAKNQFGGYTGGHTFIVVEDDGRVLARETDQRGGGMYADMCNGALARGLFPPPPVEALATSSAPASTQPVGSSAPTADGATGLALRAMPEGAYIAAVTAGSPAAAAGLKAGMVITSVNAVPLAGLGEAMVKVVDAAGVSAALTLVDGRTVKLGR